MPVPRSDASVFHAIADPTRRGVLEALVDQELPAMEIFERVRRQAPQPVGGRGKRGRAGGRVGGRPRELTQSAFSQHLAVLRRAGLVEERRSGRHRIYRVKPGPLREVVDWIDIFDKFWTDKLAGLGEYLKKQRENT
jgi:DNA-binding transcriptional ArsR family regulator